MTKSELNKLCMDENDPMKGVEVRCKHGIKLQFQPSWSDRNPGRRFWSHPHYEATNCKFFRWRDKGQVDERSKFILPRLVNKIKELEENYELVKMQLDEFENFKAQYDNSNMNAVEIEEEKQDDETENIQILFESLNINSVGLADSNVKDDAKEMGISKEKAKEKGMKMKKRKDRVDLL